MKKNCFFFIFITLLFSCNDGDIIITTLDFDTITLENCGETGDYIFYKINNDSFESLSLRLGTSDLIFNATSETEYVLDGTSNFVNFRSYDGDINDSFFCDNIAPTSPNIIDDFIGNSGVAFLQVTAIEDDNDGIATEDELDEDTDGDGLMNSIDFDDDGDNVPTSFELDTENLDGDDNPFTNPKDTDGDSIPDYLDDDDDGDGILTRYEDFNENLNPTDDITDVTIGPDYLNSAVTNSNVIDEYRTHTYSIDSDITITLQDIVMSNGNEEIVRETLPMGTINNVSLQLISIDPEFN